MVESGAASQHADSARAVVSSAVGSSGYAAPPENPSAPHAATETPARIDPKRRRHDARPITSFCRAGARTSNDALSSWRRPGPRGCMAQRFLRAPSLAQRAAPTLVATRARLAPGLHMQTRPQSVLTSIALRRAAGALP